MKSTSPPVFPLAPFLLGLSVADIHLTLDDVHRVQQVLETDICWTHARLRQVLMALLAKDCKQQESFERLYQQFQQGDDEPSGQRTLDVLLLKRDLHRLVVEFGQEQDLPKMEQAKLDEPKKKTRPFQLILIFLIASLFLGASFVLKQVILPTKKQMVPVETNLASTEIPTPTQPSQNTEPAMQEQPDKLVDTSFPDWGVWLWWLAAFGSGLFTLYLWWSLRKSLQMPELPSVISWQQDSDMYFDPAEVGGVTPAWLDDVILDYCADTIGFYVTEDDSQWLDMPATIKATARFAGLPEVRMRSQQSLLQILVLVDVNAQEQRWCPLAYELVQGLRQRGLPVILGHLYGSLNEFRTDEGKLIRVEDLADERGHYITLIFADARLADWKKDKLLLEELALWPQLAWLTVREPRFWNGREQCLQQAGIRLRTVEPTNLVAIFRELTGEMMQTMRPRIAYRRFMQRGAEEPLVTFVQRLLGDALPLVRIVAVLPPPVSPALLVRILRSFAPQLPLTRLQRLYDLPDTQADVVGLHLGVDVLRLLRGQFHQWSGDIEKKQTKEKLLAWYEAAKPNNENSLRYYSWYWLYLRLLLEFDQKQAIPELEKLQISIAPLGKKIDWELQKNALPFPLPDKDDKENQKRLMRMSKGKIISEDVIWPALRNSRYSIMWTGLFTVALFSIGLWKWQYTPIIKKEYIVQKGDTLFQIMRNTGVYWKDIIQMNNLQPPDYMIAPGQRLVINASITSNSNSALNKSSSAYYDYSGSAKENTNKANGIYTVQAGDTIFQVMRNTGVYWKDIIRLNNLQPPDYLIHPGQYLKLKDSSSIYYDYASPINKNTTSSSAYYTYEVPTGKNTTTYYSYETPSNIGAKINESDISGLMSLKKYLPNKEPSEKISNKVLMETVQQLLNWQDELLPETLTQQFDLIPISSEKSNNVGHFTGYYTPTLEGSRTRTTQFHVPIYRMPQDNIGHLSHAEIASGALANKGLEIAWVADPYLLYIAQIQGSAHIRFPDGTTSTLDYAGNNGREFQSVSAYLTAKGYSSTIGNMTHENIDSWLNAHPDIMREALISNPRYIFFREIQNLPQTVLGDAVIPGHTIAVDSRYIPLGSVLLAELPRLNSSGKQLGGVEWRLLFAQDIGRAISGEGRIDLYTGLGSTAESAAYSISGMHRVYLIIKK